MPRLFIYINSFYTPIRNVGEHVNGWNYLWKTRLKNINSFEDQNAAVQNIKVTSYLQMEYINSLAGPKVYEDSSTLSISITKLFTSENCP